MKILKWVVIVLKAAILLFVFVGMPYLKKQTKKISPERVVTYLQDGLDLEVKYSGPYKKDRIIFGELVPFDAVWRTGANEATEITITGTIKLGGQQIKPGTYTLFTIPEKDKWTIILNSELGQWGAYNYNSKLDVIRLEVPVSDTTTVFEPFTIEFEQKAQSAELVMMWDQTKVTIPIEFM